MLPVLAVIDETSKTLCTYPFLAAARRSKANRVQITGVELREALASIVGVWKRAGRTMKVLRFDRESALNGVAYPNWAVDFGLQPRPTAAGQKLGLIESYGRVLKDHSRAVLAGIKNDFGYKFPLAYSDEIIADVNCVLNRSSRVGKDRAPIQEFYGADLLSSSMDALRNMRVAIGEIVLCKTPDRGTSTKISVAKAEWGVVVKRDFHGTGEFTILSLETRHTSSRFQFVRNVEIPSYILDLARSLTTDLELHDVAPRVSEPPHPAPPPPLPWTPISRIFPLLFRSRCLFRLLRRVLRALILLGRCLRV
jgi:hypothetical protein